jgi:hypothetical protein
MAKKELKPYPGHDEFVFETPLYSTLQISDEAEKKLLSGTLTVDGYCPDCKTKRVFKMIPLTTTALARASQIDRVFYDEIIRFSCAKVAHHRISIYLRITSGMIVKYGQNPSYADLIIEQDAERTKMLGKEDRREYNKAIGLAAHDAGIGAYAYLRRIFERWIWRVFNEHKTANSWDEAEFTHKRMNEKINVLRNLLPELLVKNAGAYGILSDGLHNLSEEDCLAFFPILRIGILLILEQDIEQKARTAREAEFTKAVSTFAQKPKT